MHKRFTLKKKKEISKILEIIETNNKKLDVKKKLDQFHKSSNGHVIGITGPPGVGKSSLINKLICSFREDDLSIGIIAIDPSSKKSGGALLGDRARFDIDPDDHNIFVRSMAAKDFLGGISELTYPSMILMRSIFDIVIIETVGVGQSEVSIENVVDTVIYCVQPGSGDVLQFMKSGIIEIPDLIVVTKNDLEKIANLTIADLNSSKVYFTGDSDWEIKILSVSSRKEVGFKVLKDSIILRWKWLIEKKIIVQKRYNQDIEWIRKSLINEYGVRGLNLVEKKINLKENPFQTLNKLENMISLKLK